MPLPVNYRGALLDRLHIAYQSGNVGIGVVDASEKLTMAGGNVQLSDTGNALARSILGHFTLTPNTANTTSNLMVGIRNQNSLNYGASVRFAYEGTTGVPGNTDSRIEF